MDDVKPTRADWVWAAVTVVVGVLTVGGLVWRMVRIARGDMPVPLAALSLLGGIALVLWLTGGAWQRTCWGCETDRQ